MYWADTLWTRLFQVPVLKDMVTRVILLSLFSSSTSGTGALTLSYVMTPLSPTANPWVWEQVRKAAQTALSQPTNL